jgi:hypothetical protein
MEPVRTAPARVTPIVLDLGRRKRKHVKQLRKGDGELLAEVEEAVARLKAAGEIAADARPVIVVVREKARQDDLLSRLKL